MVVTRKQRQTAISDFLASTTGFFTLDLYRCLIGLKTTERHTIIVNDDSSESIELSNISESLFSTIPGSYEPGKIIRLVFHHPSSPLIMKLFALRNQILLYILHATHDESSSTSTHNEYSMQLLTPEQFIMKYDTYIRSTLNENLSVSVVRPNREDPTVLTSMHSLINTDNNNLNRSIKNRWRLNTIPNTYDQSINNLRIAIWSE